MRNYSEKPQVKLQKNVRFSSRPRAGGTQTLSKEAQEEELFKTYIHYVASNWFESHTQRGQGGVNEAGVCKNQ